MWPSAECMTGQGGGDWVTRHSGVHLRETDVGKRSRWDSASELLNPTSKGPTLYFLLCLWVLMDDLGQREFTEYLSVVFLSNQRKYKHAEYKVPSRISLAT